ncbi:hypothetical protein GCM10010441_00030 [Kitasatospora paracochleata]|uniref:D-alanyl-D-alanine carboxypeptidase n=1 Tax=Kitasatospora paracochleata TaxID=58354 RepID=A0ABT1IXI4_9ACTN|nr:serine hydrolase domain-containing protein [Kitasatospora paracochleata]MCP2309628.1 D-alanyl-D-alanine carboxypeptidase [Kitasatospora paracochleata]
MPFRSRRKARPTAAVLSAVLAVLLAGPAAADPSHGRPGHDGGDPALQARLQELVDDPLGPPGAIAVLREGNHLQVYRAGTAETGTDRAPRATDHMRLASTAKAFSGAVALRLVDCGLLGLDDTIGQRLPTLPARWAPVTLRQLLQHTSGMPDYTEDPDFRAVVNADPHRIFDSRHLLDFVAGQDLRFTPGSQYRYSNSDNIAIALMAEAATGKRYEDLLGEEVYRPLHLRETSLPAGFEMPEPYLHGYQLDPPNAPEDVSTLVSMSGAWASGGMVSTPSDFSAFMAAYGGGRLLSPATVAAQRTFVAGSSEPAGPGVNRAGLAIFEYTTRCGVVYGHTGNIFGYTQLGVGTPDGSRSLSFSLTRQVGSNDDPAFLARMRAVQEDFVCALLND